MGSAYVVPQTWQDETYPDNTAFNREVRDNLNHVKYPPYAASALATARTTTATTFAAINTALNLVFTTYGGYIKVGLVGNGGVVGGPYACYDIALNGTRISPSVSGATIVGDSSGNAFFTRTLTGRPSGVYTAQAQYRADVGTTTARAISGLLLWAYEVP